MEFRTELMRIKGLIDREMGRQLDILIEEIPVEDELMIDVLSYLKKIALAGGKRVRPALMIYGHIAAGGDETEELIQAAVGVELIHIFLLMHDDIMDRDDVRHGEFTMHAHYKEQANILFDRGDSVHFGISTAILVGDFCHALGTKLIYSAGFDPARTIQVLTALQDVVQRTVRGQFQDILLEHTGEKDEVQIFKVYENKTARYTIEGPLHMGAILAGANQSLLEELSHCAIPLGIAFQIQDDLLGIFGSQEKTGKPVGSDIEEGKMTLLVSRAFSGADARQQKRLDELLGKANISDEEIQEFRSIVRTTGALESIEQEIADRFMIARDKLQAVNCEESAVKFLGGMIDYLEKREV